MVVSLRILLVHKVGIVGADQLDAILMSQFDEHLVRFLLLREGLTVSADSRVFDLVALQFQVVVVTKYTMIPLHSLTSTLNVAIKNLLGHLAGYTCRADNQALMVFLQVLTVGTRTHIIAVNPRTADQLDQILITLIVLSQHDEMVTTLMFLITLERLRAIARNIHLATENGLERFQSLLLATFVDTIHIVVKFFDTEHITVIGDSHTFHAITNSLVYQSLNA